MPFEIDDDGDFRELELYFNGLEENITDAAHEIGEDSLADLRQKVVSALNQRQLRSEGYDRTRHNIHLNTYKAWEISQTGDTSFQFHPHPSVAERAYYLEYGHDPATKSGDPQKMYTFRDKDGSWVNIPRENLNERRENASGWFRKMVRRWLREGDIESNAAQEIEQLLRAPNAYA